MAYGRRNAAKKKRIKQLRIRLMLFAFAVVLVTAGILVHKFRDNSSKSATEEVNNKDSKETEKLTKEPETEVSGEGNQKENVDEPETEEQRLERVKKEAKEAGYPEGVIKLLTKNPETVEYVEKYGELKDKEPEDIIAEYEDGKVPFILQWDERWGYSPYGTSVVAVCGCGPTCLSMVVTALTGDNTLTPDKLAAYGTEHGYITEENDTRWAFMTEACEEWGVVCTEKLLSEKELKDKVEKGHPVVCSVGPGAFTDKGHFIVIAGVEDGKFIIHDPFSRKNTEKRWEYKEFEDQIKTMWIYSKK